jgi:hypothetical protein
MGQGFRIRDIVDRDPFGGWIALRGSDDVPPDPSEAVNSYFDGHLNVPPSLCPLPEHGRCSCGLDCITNQ